MDHKPAFGRGGTMAPSRWSSAHSPIHFGKSEKGVWMTTDSRLERSFESLVRTGLAAGGNRIRTFGSGSLNFYWKTADVIRDRLGRPNTGADLWGTEGSNLNRP